MKFVDEAKIIVEGGAGGNGCISFRREKFVPRGGPDGGDGGTGGSIYLVGSRSLQTLYDLKLKPCYRAGRGVHGKGKGMDGRDGDDVQINVPLGAIIFDHDDLIGEILNHGERILVACGGRGGRGNRHFATPHIKAPRMAESGKPGEKKELKIVLKIISDIGIVGFPNSGKSTLLKAITNAQPAIGAYPFTTLTPNLGVLRHGLKNVVLGDMPGIIKGAHAGKGLGFKFLKHIERTKKLVILVDITAPEPVIQYHNLLEEFKKYDEELLKKPRIIVFNKIDLLKKCPHFNLGEETFYISALKHQGLEKLLKHLVEPV